MVGIHRHRKSSRWTPRFSSASYEWSILRICKDRTFCLPPATRRCDVGLDKVSHQQIQPSGWLSGGRNTAPGWVEAQAVLLSAHGRVPASRIHNVHTLQQLSGLSAIHHFPETRRAFRRASTCERHGSHGQGGCTPSRAIVHECCTRDVPFLGALTCEKRYRRRLYLFLRPAGRRVFFGVARTIYVARGVFLAGRPRSFDVLRLERPNDVQIRSAFRVASLR
jgi:hypothetical protein